MQLLKTNAALNGLIAIVFVLTCFVPPQVTFAFEDCGQHRIVVCEEHRHFVAAHVKDTKEELDFLHDSVTHGDSSHSEEHDIAHQIEPSLQFIAATTKHSIELKSVTHSARILLVFTFVSSLSVTLTSSKAPPDPTNSFLSFLPSVRLQV